MQVIAVWNKAAQLRLINHNPTWVRDLACNVPEAKRKQGVALSWLDEEIVPSVQHRWG